MPIVEERQEVCRRELRKVAGSVEFASSRQLRDFLLYVGEAALTGKTHIDQAEIAREVLHRSQDFNPVDDSSVRKLGSLLRQRLERYYAGEGANDEVLISLPVRSYVPIFVERPVLLPRLAAPNGQGHHPVVAASPLRGHPRPFWRACAGLLVLGFGAGFAVRHAVDPSRVPDTAIVLRTVQGDFLHKNFDLPPSAIQLGPAVGTHADLIARLRFRPEYAGQQAGLLLFHDPDNYVRLARHFTSRTYFEFGAETAGIYPKPAGTFEFDSHGQDGQPIWLLLRRSGGSARAFRSADREQWVPVGGVADIGAHPAPARIGIYANRARTDSPEAAASFDQLAHGLVFQGRPDGPVDANSFPGWTLTSNCDPAHGALLERGLLLLDSSGPARCSISLSHPVPAGDWTLSTKLDFIPAGGAQAGLFVRGSQARARLVRWDLSGGSLTAELDHRKQASRRDFGGHPPLFLRLTARNGIVKASFSRDGVVDEEVPLDAPLSALGSKLVFGIQASRSSWSNEQPITPARFAWVLQEFRSTHGLK